MGSVNWISYLTPLTICGSKNSRSVNGADVSGTNSTPVLKCHL